MLSRHSYEQLFPDFIEAKLAQTSLDKSPFDFPLQLELSSIESAHGVHLVEVLVGRGNNSRDQHSPDRPILTITKQTLN